MTLIKEDIARYISAKITLSKIESIKYTELILRCLKEVILNEKDINILRVGRFILRQKKERTGRNPISGEAMTITKRDVILFHPSKLLKDELNGVDVSKRTFNYSTELTEYIYKKIKNIILNVPIKFVNDIVNAFFECINFSILKGERIEIRGFGAFTLRVYDSYYGRNPKTCEQVFVEGKILPFFKFSKNFFC